MAEATIAHTARTVTFPNIPAPLPAITRILSRYERPQLAGFIEVAIGLLDVIDGDPDLELIGDETDHNGAEDDFIDHACNSGCYAGPGCPISDDDSEHDGREVTGAEDDYMVHSEAGPGCPISDPGGCQHD